MGFCSLSREMSHEGYTLIDNLFLSEELPAAPEGAVRVYLYGLYLADSGRDGDVQTLDDFAKKLAMSTEDVFQHFLCWEQKNLVRLTSKSPLRIEYLPLKISERVKKYKPGKYSDFNMHAQSLFPKRQITPTEYTAYYETLEDTKMSPDALLMIMQYCISVKGENVGYKYVKAVAESWGRDGIVSAEDVETRLKEHEAASEDVRKLFSAMKLTRKISFEDRQTYLKLQKSWGFSREAITTAAQNLKGKKSMERLEEALDTYFKQSIFTAHDIQAYNDRKNHSLKLTKDIAKRLSQYLESAEFAAGEYTDKWLEKGYDDEKLLMIAKLCFARNIKSIGQMDAVINDLSGNNIFDEEKIKNHLSSSNAKKTEKPANKRDYTEQELKSRYAKKDDLKNIK